VFIIRATKKLLKEINANPTQINIYNPILSWHANIFVKNRRKCVIFINDLTLLNITMVGIRSSQLKHLDKLFLEELKNYLISEDIEPKLINAFIDEGQEMIVTTTNNRSVISSMNDIVLIMDDISSVNLNTIELNKWNNRTIYKPIKYKQPIEAFKEELNNM
jgi:hypothetical protein